MYGVCFLHILYFGRSSVNNGGCESFARVSRSNPRFLDSYRLYRPCNFYIALFELIFGSGNLQGVFWTWLMMELDISINYRPLVSNVAWPRSATMTSTQRPLFFFRQSQLQILLFGQITFQNMLETTKNTSSKQKKKKQQKNKKQEARNNKQETIPKREFVWETPLSQKR